MLFSPMRHLKKYLVLSDYSQLWLLTLTLFATLLWLSCGKGNGKAADRSGGAGGQKVMVEYLVIHPELLRNTIYTTGTLLANEEVELRSEIAGRVTGVYFSEGRRVKKGELLVKINDRELQAELHRKEVEERQASDDVDRKRKLFEINSISQEDYDKSVNSLRIVQADKEAIASRIAETEIKAPFDGMVGLRHVSEGGYITPDVGIATVQDVNTMKVEFSVPERRAGQLKEGTEIAVMVGESTEGYLGAVFAVESKIDAGTRTISARAKIPNAHGALIPGSFAKVEITLEQIPSAIVVPSGAVIPNITGETVYVCKGGKAQSIAVKTGIRTERGTQITDGLAENDTLIVTGLLQLTNGKQVELSGGGKN